ncbi:MAG: hypothetical protein B5766_01825 [Candidatus Lumbricidophila eiseniae]|uniref:ABC transporter domain-containing protein n=1 Tax=Candidatus Lumbricidiphila eiseniae TaxID=1969409 RepID=A0A2A6FU43_9MICO|nr:MAG: hypothetical protein B5766_01825 [Candidatus Lumbricidophila eiseniae]
MRLQASPTTPQTCSCRALCTTALTRPQSTSSWVNSIWEWESGHPDSHSPTSSFRSNDHKGVRMSLPEQPILVCTALTKTFGNIRALSGVDFTLQAGEVRALLGKNGAGKSTLVNIVSGSVAPDSGTIELAGNTVAWSGPGAARLGGISVVHQEFSLVPGLTVAENITLGRWPSVGGFLKSNELADRARRAIDMLGVNLPETELVGNLPIAQQQLVEIAKALIDEPRVLILDEPTSALNASEVETLIALVRRLASQNVAIIYVSHRMKEIPLVADTITVMRDGREVRTMPVTEATAETVASLIAGDSESVNISELRNRLDAPVVLSVSQLHIPGTVENVSFDLHEGEVLGIAGFLGSGRTELLEAIFGLRQDARGEVRIGGTEIVHRTPRKMLNLKVAMTSEDRKTAGIVPLLGIGENIVLSARSRVLPKGWLRATRESVLQENILRTLSIRASSAVQEIGTLSGGNQQKGVIGRALAADMRVLLLDEPTRGIDVQAKAQIYSLIRELALGGVASIFVSSELEELTQVCDRVIIIRAGRNREELVGAQASADKILSLVLKEED